jgi:hypothetical protein
VVLFLLWGKPLIPVAEAIAMFLSLLVVPVVSLLTQPPKPEITATAFGDKSSLGSGDFTFQTVTAGAVRLCI